MTQHVTPETPLSTETGPEAVDWMIRNRAVTGIARGKDKSVSGIRRRITVADINVDTLGEREFFRVLDPATAHMRISSFVGGVLPVSEDLVEISDQDRIVKAGFDRRSSFRKGPTKAGKRRKVG